jgi:hypothetical protein
MSESKIDEEPVVKGESQDLCCLHERHLRKMSGQMALVLPTAFASNSWANCSPAPLSHLREAHPAQVQ